MRGKRRKGDGDDVTLIQHKTHTHTLIDTDKMPDWERLQKRERGANGLCVTLSLSLSRRRGENVTHTSSTFQGGGKSFLWYLREGQTSRDELVLLSPLSLSCL